MLKPAINGDRLWDSLMEMAKIGATEKGGCCRLALTDLDKQGRDLFVQWCEQAGCTVKVDKMGNIFARREGTDSNLPAVLTGSHLDTQPTGGRFDGVYGVLTGLEVIRSLNDMGIQTRHSIEACVWTNEEALYFHQQWLHPVFLGAYSTLIMDSIEPIKMASLWARNFNALVMRVKKTLVGARCTLILKRISNKGLFSKSRTRPLVLSPMRRVSGGTKSRS
jgi:hypothetical protein